MTLQIQSTVKALQWKHFCPAISTGSYGRFSMPPEEVFANPFFFFAERDVNMRPNRPFQTASVDSSKFFDRRNWDALGQSLLEHSVSALVV